MVTFDDITDRLQLEEQLSRQERLASLGSVVAAGVAHEINTPHRDLELHPDAPRGHLARRPAPRPPLQDRGPEPSSILDRQCTAQSGPAREGNFEDLSLNDAVAEVLHWFAPEVTPRAIRVDSRLDPALPTLHGHKEGSCSRCS